MTFKVYLLDTNIMILPMKYFDDYLSCLGTRAGLRGGNGGNCPGRIFTKCNLIRWI